MHENLPFAGGIIFLIVPLVLLAKEIRAAFPVLLVLAGLGLCFIQYLLKRSIEARQEKLSDPSKNFLSPGQKVEDLKLRCSASV